MSQTKAFTELRFEPHNGYGTSIDGEPMPFGYISEKGYGKPVFELSPIFAHDARELTGLALKMAAAPEMLEALHDILTRPTDGAARERVRAAIAKAEGRA